MIGKLANDLAHSFRNTNPTNRVREFVQWTGRSKHSTDYSHTDTVVTFYDLCTELMNWGWDDSLHFAPLQEGEKLTDAILRHERLMIQKLGLTAESNVIDVGCGTGGPMRTVAKETSAQVMLVNINAKQLAKAKAHNEIAGLEHQATYQQCDFQDMSAIPGDSFDAAYAIESTCHAGNKEKAFEEICRVLKPGGLFWGQEMCLTNSFDQDDQTHQSIKQDLMQTIALYDIYSFNRVEQALAETGFQVIEAEDLGSSTHSPVPWYFPMRGMNSLSFQAFRRTPVGRTFVRLGIGLAELCRLFPKGTKDVIAIMESAAQAYVRGGEAGIFTPLFCFLACKSKAT